MTPRTMEEVLFEELKSQMQNSAAFYDLSLDNRLFDVDHPKVLRAKMLFEANNDLEIEPFQHPQFKAAFYSDLSEAQQYHPSVEKNFRGTPKNIHLWLKNAEDVIIDFSPLGAAVISKGELAQKNSTGVHRHTLPIWLSYALSPELWGPVGKWTRFHERLHTLFEKYELLNGEDFPGFYPLKNEAKLLKQAGFRGSETDQSFILNLNWTFPLAALVKLEEVVTKEH